jgi:hypothetical protein
MSRPLLAGLSAAFLLVLQATPVLAQAQTKKELVARILTLQQPSIEGLARGLAERPALELAAEARQFIGKIPEDKREAVVKAIDADLKKYVDEAVPLVRDKAIALSPAVLGAELDTHFNEAELKQLLNWFESPVIKRYNQLVPGIQQALTEKLVAETRTQIEPKVRTLQSAMAKHLGLPAPGSAPAASPAPATGASPGMPGNRGSGK